MQLVDIAGGGVAVTGDSRATYKARRDIKAHGAKWNKEAKQWEAHDPAAVASLRAWFGLPVQDATPNTITPEESAPMVADDPAPMDTAAPAPEVAPMATPSDDPTDQGTDPTTADGVQGAAYGDSQKSQIFMNPGEVYKTAKANRYIIILSDDGDKIRTTDAVLGRFSGNIDKSDKESFLNCLEAGSIIKADASQLPPVTDVHTWREGLENGHGDAFQIRTELIYAAADAMTEAEKADTAARMGFALPLDPLAVMDAAALHKWNASRGNYKNCAALEWLVTQQDEPAAFQMNAGAYPVIFADYARRICAYGVGQKSQNFEDVAVSVPDVKEYRLMYLFGAWVGHSRVYAETDAEAIHDATDNYISSTLPRWAHRVALWEGSRLVHVFKEDGPDDIGRRDMEQEKSENAPAYIVHDTTEEPYRFDDCATGSILAAVDRVAENEHTANPHPLQLFADGVKVWDREEHPTEYLAHIVRQRLAL